MRILYIIPEFNEGGVETHVCNLIHELTKRGHEITLLSRGGKLEAQLPECVKIFHMPVDRKNLFTGIYCALKISGLSKKFRWDIIHAHSRVPAWIAWLAASAAKIKWLMTAHALYSLNFGIKPLKHADGVICVSEAVKNHLYNYLPNENIIIPNGIKISEYRYKDFDHDKIKFLFAGRLTRLKGLDVALQALSGLKNYEWSFDIIGDGPQRQELENLACSLEISERVKFHGSKTKNELERFMACSSCLLFPSYQEGMGLVVLEALSIGLPVIASDLEALREISSGGLVPAGNIMKWREAVKKFLDAGISCSFNPEKIITIHEMAIRTENFYTTKI